MTLVNAMTRVSGVKFYSPSFALCCVLSAPSHASLHRHLLGPLLFASPAHLGVCVGEFACEFLVAHLLLPVYTPCTSETAWFVTFLIELTLLSTLFSGPTHGSQRALFHPSLWLSCIHVCVCVCVCVKSHIFCIQSPLEGPFSR